MKLLTPELVTMRLGTHALRLRRLEDAASVTPEVGPQGPPGPEGPPGPKGDKPDHEWSDTRLRFEKPDGSWGKFVDLQGPRGRGGGRLFGGGAPTVVTTSGGGFVPTRIRAGETFVVPADTQALFAAPVDCEGILEVNGMLIQCA